MRRRSSAPLAAWLTLLGGWAGPSAQPAQASVVLEGRVLSEDGEPLSGAIVIASTGSFFGWSETAADGRFELEERGAFLTVRHEEFKPALIEVDRNQQEVLVLLQPVDDSI